MCTITLTPKQCSPLVVAGRVHLPVASLSQPVIQPTLTVGGEHNTALGFVELDRKAGCGAQLCPLTSGTINSRHKQWPAERLTASKGLAEVGERNEARA